MSKYMIDSWMQDPEADHEGGEGDMGDMLDEEEDEKLEVIEKEEKVPTLYSFATTMNHFLCSTSKHPKNILPLK